MRQVLPYILWSAVIIVAGLMLARSSGLFSSGPAPDQPLVYRKAFNELPWKHLPTVSDFEFTERNGSRVRRSDFHGQPFVVSFFFADCPTICRDLNDRIKLLQEPFKKDDLAFLSVTCDPENDTPARLQKYADSYSADSEKWLFLTGPLADTKRFGRQSFRAVIELPNHTEDIFLIDRWGRVRDRFRWDDPDEMKRFNEVARQVVDETAPPLEETVRTRNVLAGKPPTAALMPPWIDEFYLTTQANKPFFSRDLTGTVWIGSIFFSTCTTHCVKQNEYLRDLQGRLPPGVVIASITTDPLHDTPAVLAAYAADIKADPARWFFLTGDDEDYVQKIIAEYFGQFVAGQDHGTALAVVDRWGNVRGKFNWNRPDQEAEMFRLIDVLQQEDRPAPPSSR